jgi:mycoredoxin
MLRKLFIIAILAMVVQRWDEIQSFIQPLVNAEAAEQQQVTLYATSWCGYCAKTRKLLDDNHIAYTEYDIESSEEGNRQYKALGGQGIPVLQIGTEVVNGYNPGLILRLAKSAG